MKRVINLTPINYWAEQPFLNRALAAKVGGQQGLYIFGSLIVPMDSPGAVFELLWDGGGSVQVGPGAAVTTTSAGGIEFTWSGATPSLQLTLRSASPTNIRVVRKDELPAFNAGEIFCSDFLADVSGFTAFRCMDWMQTNGSTRTDVLTNGLIPTVGVDGTGVAPLALIVALANKTGMRPWINLPLGIADNAAKAAFAYLQANCTPKPIIELSNEIWNTKFAQAKTAQSLAPATRLKDGLYYYGQRAGQLAVLARGSGIGFVLCGQLVSAFRMANVFAGVADSGALDSDFEAVAPATYITGDLTNYGKFPTLATGLQAAINTDGAHDNMMAALPTWQSYYAAWGTLAKAHGLKLWAYEGNFHLNAIGLSSTATTDQLNALAAFYESVQASPRAPVTYAAYAAAFAAAGADMDAVFNLTSPPSIGGNFGIKFFPETWAWIKADMAPSVVVEPPTPSNTPTLADALAQAKQVVSTLEALTQNAVGS